MEFAFVEEGQGTESRGGEMLRWTVVEQVLLDFSQVRSLFRAIGTHHVLWNTITEMLLQTKEVQAFR